MQKKIGILYVVATPIGNLQDITLRAIEILKKVNRIAAEDTRHAAALLKHFSITTPTISLHDFNERERAEKLIQQLLQGEDLALISDAGTPLISDPGFYLVRAARAQGINIVPIPGACAAIAALCASGLAADRFSFQGFLPAKAQARQELLKALLHETQTMIFYEAPHRLLETLQAMQESFGPERKAVLVRELTKIHETFLPGELQTLIAHVQSNANATRGEIVLLVEGAPEATLDDAAALRILHLLLEELPIKQAAALASKITGERKNKLYELALKEKKRGR